MLVEPQLEIRQVAEHAVPRAALERRRAAGAGQIVARARAQARGHERQQHRADPAPQVPGIAVRGIVVHRQATRGDVLDQIVVRERQQRAHQSAAGSRRHAGEPGGPAPAQQPQQNRLDLVVAVVRRHKVARRTASPHVGEPCVARSPRRGFRGVRTEVQLSQLERQPVPARQGGDRLSHARTARLHPVVRVPDDQRETELRSEAVHQVEQRDRIGSPRHRHHRGPPADEEAAAGDVLAHAGEQRGHTVV